MKFLQLTFFLALLPAIAFTQKLNGQLKNGSGTAAAGAIRIRSSIGGISGVARNAQVKAIPPDSLALVAFYNKMGGKGWIKSDNWLKGKLDTWYGLTFVNDRLASIKLVNNNLSGVLSSEIKEFTELSSLVLAGNHIGGNLPEEVGLLKKLAKIDLSGNMLNAQLPAGINNATALKKLYLQGNLLSDIQALTLTFDSLDLSKNKLTFEDLVPNAGQSTVFTSSPQDSVGAGDDLIVDEGGSLTLTSNVGVSQGPTFEWFRNNQKIANTNSTLVLNNVTAENDNGKYYYVSSHPLVPDLKLFSKRYSVFVSSRKADSLALVDLYNATNGNNWLNRTNWLVAGKNIDTWFGVAFSSALSRVTGIKLNDNNMVGIVPNSLGTLKEISSLDLTGNKISGNVPGSGSWKKLVTLKLGNNSLTAFGEGLFRMTSLKEVVLKNNFIEGAVSDSVIKWTQLENLELQDNLISGIPGLKSLSALKLLKVENNKLTFEDLEPNYDITGITYSPQKEVGDPKQIVVDFGATAKVSQVIGGSDNNYQWKRNAVAITDAKDSTFTVEVVNRNTVGKYTLEATSNIVPNLKLVSAQKRVDAKIDISGSIENGSVVVNQGNVYLLEVGEKIYFDTLQVYKLTDNTFTFQDAYLRDYMIQVNPAKSVFPDLLSTYLGNVIYWNEADTLVTQGDTSNIVINMGGIPAPTVGPGLVEGDLSQEDALGTGKRILAGGKRVAKAGVTLRRRSTSKKTLAGINYELVSYTTTDDEGHFKIPNLPNGVYNMKIEFPGIPMDESSDVDFEVSPTKQQLTFDAVVTEKGIVVDLISVLGFEVFDYEVNILDLFPNPAERSVAIHSTLKKGNEQQVLLYNNQGGLSKSIPVTYGPDGEIVISLDGLAPGLYTICMVNKNAQTIGVGKLVVK